MKQLTPHITCQQDAETGLNIYRIDGAEKSALIDFGNIPEAYYQEIDYLVLNQVLPSSLQALKPVLRKKTELTVIGTAPILNFAREFMEYDFRQLPIRPSAAVDLGGLTLKLIAATNVSRAKHQDRTWKKSYRFLQMPNWQWMDSVYGCCPEEDVLFSGQLFSDTGNGQEDYFRAHQRPFPQEVRRSLKALARFKCQQALPAYGTTASFPEAVQKWEHYLNSMERQQQLVLIPYASQFGFTAQMAELIADGIQENTALCAETVAVSADNLEQVILRIEQADAVIAGTPTIEEDAAPAMRMLFAKLPKNACRGKLGAVFGNYSYTPKGTAPLLTRMRQLEMRVIDTPFHIRFRADDEMLPLLKEFGAHIAACLLQNEIREFLPKPQQPEPQKFQTNRKFLILGNGAAGTTAAQEIRKLDESCQIELLSEEAVSGYNRQILTRGILNDLSHDRLKLRPDAWYAARSISTAFGVRAESIDPQAQTVTCSDGTVRAYDKLIFATGAHPVMPQSPESKPEGIYPVHALDEVQQIHRYLETHSVHNVLILGGGILGLETAHELAQSQQKFHITIADAAPHLMSRHVDDKAGALIAEHLQKQNIAAVNNARLQQFAGKEHVEAVIFENGQKYPAELVILCMGIQENTQLLQPEGGAITVNSKMETNFPNIYACGDCAAFQNINLGLWTQALEMAKTAAANAVGVEKHYQAAVPAITFTGLGLNLFSIGSIDQLSERTHRTKSEYDPLSGCYQKLYFTEDRFAGGLLLGNADAAAELIEAYQTGHAARNAQSFSF